MFLFSTDRAFYLQNMKNKYINPTIGNIVCLVFILVAIVILFISHYYFKLSKNIDDNQKNTNNDQKNTNNDQKNTNNDKKNTKNSLERFRQIGQLCKSIGVLIISICIVVIIYLRILQVDYNKSGQELFIYDLNKSIEQNMKEVANEATKIRKKITTIKDKIFNKTLYEELVNRINLLNSKYSNNSLLINSTNNDIPYNNLYNQLKFLINNINQIEDILGNPDNITKYNKNITPEELAMLETLAAHKSTKDKFTYTKNFILNLLNNKVFIDLPAINSNGPIILIHLAQFNVLFDSFKNILSNQENIYTVPILPINNNFIHFLGNDLEILVNSGGFEVSLKGSTIIKSKNLPDYEISTDYTTFSATLNNNIYNFIVINKYTNYYVFAIISQQNKYTILMQTKEFLYILNIQNNLITSINIIKKDSKNRYLNREYTMIDNVLTLYNIDFSNNYAIENIDIKWVGNYFSIKWKNLNLIGNNGLCLLQNNRDNVLIAHKNNNILSGIIVNYNGNIRKNIPNYTLNIDDLYNKTIEENMEILNSV